jgi:hypothetical protein
MLDVGLPQQVDHYPGTGSVAFDTNDSGDFDSDEEVAAALDAGAATDIGVVKSFVCPVIQLSGR